MFGPTARPPTHNPPHTTPRQTPHPTPPQPTPPQVPSIAFISVSTALALPPPLGGVGGSMAQLWLDTAHDDPNGSGVLAAAIAHLSLNVLEHPHYSPYLAMLPTPPPPRPPPPPPPSPPPPQSHGSKGPRAPPSSLPLSSLPSSHPLWWSDADVENLRGDARGEARGEHEGEDEDGSEWVDEWVELRHDVSDSVATICNALAADVRKHGQEKVSYTTPTAQHPMCDTHLQRPSYPTLF